MLLSSISNTRFYHSEHYNFVGRMNKKGTMENFEPLIVSALVETTSLRLNVCSRNVFILFYFIYFILFILFILFVFCFD